MLLARRWCPYLVLGVTGLAVVGVVTMAAESSQSQSAASDPGIGLLFVAGLGGAYIVGATLLVLISEAFGQRWTLIRSIGAIGLSALPVWVAASMAADFLLSSR